MFMVKLGSKAAFEKVWRERDAYLAEPPGFVEFSLLKSATAKDHTLYSSHPVWATKADFENWTKSQQFRDARRNAGNNAPLYLGDPEFEGFESVLELLPKGKAA